MRIEFPGLVWLCLYLSPANSAWHYSIGTSSVDNVQNSRFTSPFPIINSKPNFKSQVNRYLRCSVLERLKSRLWLQLAESVGERSFTDAHRLRGSSTRNKKKVSRVFPSTTTCLVLRISQQEKEAMAPDKKEKKRKGKSYRGIHISIVIY